ncbi:hypothetical protein B2J93_1667 [Marssonina coronariae]|uniref:Uncharacterized protein n=1 Tax=Diplocarpon coronariae TaxID=2795749 RepID=A0A218ZC93_9HELO|nr:hypothetical protein B2J93_1667 [Marssonina coronariae]
MASSRNRRSSRPGEMQRAFSVRSSKRRRNSIGTVSTRQSARSRIDFQVDNAPSHRRAAQQEAPHARDPPIVRGTRPPIPDQTTLVAGAAAGRHSRSRNICRSLPLARRSTRGRCAEAKAARMTRVCRGSCGGCALDLVLGRREKKELWAEFLIVDFACQRPRRADEGGRRRPPGATKTSFPSPP